MSSTLVGLHVAKYRLVSPIDELQHIDYVHKAGRFEFVGQGELFGQEALRDQACRGIDAPVTVPSCDSKTFDPKEFQEAGFNTAFIHPPTYYALTAWIGSVVDALTPSGDLVTGGRLTGALWLGLGLVFLWSAMGELQVRDGTRAGVLMFTMSAPIVLFQSATITPDATALLAGSMCLWAVLRWDSDKLAWWVPALTAGAAVAFKSTNVVGIGTAVLFLMIRYAQLRKDPDSRSESRRPEWWVVAGMGAATGLVSVAYLFVSSRFVQLSTDEIPMFTRFHAATFPFSGLVHNVGIMPLQLTDISIFSEDSLVVLSAVVGIALILFALGALSVGGARVRAVTAAGLAMVVLTGPLFVIVNYVLSEIYVIIPSRYGLAAAPAVLCGAAVSLDKAVPRWLVPAAGFGSVGLTAAMLIF